MQVETAKFETWNDISSSLPWEFKLPDYANGPHRVTPSSQLETVRLFGKSEEDVRVVLYRDTFYWCPYCERVQLLLELKRVPYTVQKVDLNCYGLKPAWFKEKVQGGWLPAIEIDGQVVTESVDIMKLLDQTFSNEDCEALIRGKYQTEDILKAALDTERQLNAVWLQWLRGRQEISQEQLEFNFSLALKNVEYNLEYEGGPFFGGASPNFVDCVYAPLLERMQASILYWKGIDIETPTKFLPLKFPRLSAWFAAARAQPLLASFAGGTLSHVKSLPPQIGRCYFAGDAIESVARIEKIGAGYALDIDEAAKDARLEAAAALCNNHPAVILDAVAHVAKGGGEVPEGFEGEVDEAFRMVAFFLAQGEAGALEKPKFVARKEVALALAYERERVCTPRDMSLAASRQFQGAVNHVLESLA